MAILTIKIDDETLEKYREKDPKSPQKAIEATLERFKDLPLGRRVVILDDADRKELEGFAGQGFENGKALVKWVKERITVSLAGVSVALKEGQRKKLLAEALFWKQPVEKYLTAKLSRVIDREFGGF